MQKVNIGIVGLGNVGLGTIAVLTENQEQISQKLGFDLRIRAVCSPNVARKKLPPQLAGALRTTDWREVVGHPDVDIVAELIGGTTVARDVIIGAIRQRKSIVTANKELIALAGGELWEEAIRAGINLAMEASVAGGIPIHSVLREGISGDRIQTLLGILNGTSNFILTEIEKSNAAFDSVLLEAQRLGYAEADPSADIDGFDARSKLAILSALAFGEKITPADIYTEGIRRIQPIDFQYASRLNHTIRLLCTARQIEEGLLLSVRPALVPKTTILAGVQGAYNAIWVKGMFGGDTFYYGRGAGPHPTGVAVASDLMRVAREIRSGSPERVSPFAHERLGAWKPIPITSQRLPFYMRFRVKDRPGIIAALASILAEKHIGLDAVLQLPSDSRDSLPFVITVEPSSEKAVRGAVAEMNQLDFMVEPALVMPLEKGL